MKVIRCMIAILLLTGMGGPSAAAQSAKDNFLLKERVGNTNYCHMQFPAIREDTLSWNRPVLQDKSTTDIIDYYGPCDHDPLGKEEIQQQRHELKFEREEDDGD